MSLNLVSCYSDLVLYLCCVGAFVSILSKTEMVGPANHQTETEGQRPRIHFEGRYTRSDTVTGSTLSRSGECLHTDTGTKNNNVGPYDFHDAENVDRIVESSPKNGIYCITRNITEFAKFRIDKSRVGQYTEMKTQYGLVSVNIKLQKCHLNMNPACSVYLCVNEWCRCTVLK